MQMCPVIRTWVSDITLMPSRWSLTTALSDCVLSIEHSSIIIIASAISLLNVSFLQLWVSVLGPIRISSNRCFVSKLFISLFSLFQVNTANNIHYQWTRQWYSFSPASLPLSITPGINKRRTRAEERQRDTHPKLNIGTEDSPWDASKATGHHSV